MAGGLVSDSIYSSYRVSVLRRNAGNPTTIVLLITCLRSLFVEIRPHWSIRPGLVFYLLLFTRTLPSPFYILLSSFLELEQALLRLAETKTS